jgi:TatD DNase family protein
LFLGIGGIVTFKTADGLREAVLAAGLERLVLETDAPYLAPNPHRGQRNEPAFIAETAAYLGRLFTLPTDQVIARTRANGDALFGPAET